MRVICRGMLLEVYESKKTDMVYYTFADLESGGQLVMAVQGRLDGMRIGTLCNMDVMLKGRLYNGRLSLTYEGQGKFQREEVGSDVS